MFPRSENSLAVLRARYLKRDARTGEPSETPDDLFRRVASVVAGAERAWGDATHEDEDSLTEAFHGLMARGTFLPNSPALMNAGREMGMLHACFVLPVEDSIRSIFDTLRDAALIQKAGGGTGFDFSRLRPAGDLVRSSGGRASGPVSFLQVYSAATAAIQQGAFRRGANMGILKATHPDIVEFIRSKDDKRELTNFNISVSLTDAFMRQAEEQPNSPHLVTNPRTGATHPLPKKGEPGAFWSAGELLRLIADRAWESGEPGVIFIDRINRDNMTPALGDIDATNPCSEQPLLPYEACTLGSINLATLVLEKTFDFEELRRTTRAAVRFLDDVVEASRYPVAETEKISKLNRKIGVGVMGFADALFLLGVPYDSPEGLRVGEEIMRTLNDEAHAASEALARSRGPFPGWRGSRWDRERGRLQRNAAATTVAPTGTISIIAGCSGGIEPLFSLAFHRNILDGRKLLELNPIFARRAREGGFFSQRLVDRILEEGSLRNIPDVPDDVKRVFVTARDVSPGAHLSMQAAFQRHCDSGISKTVNFPATATIDDVLRIYRQAHHEGLKGVTVYRDGSRPNQPMALVQCDSCD
jgi:ribonucleoside-diphosphate reductase alpha chain